jgi:glycosyltransferase involved in cell wall biosynthesis
MKSADLLVHPAREEAAGNIIIEAMVSGTSIYSLKRSRIFR